MALPEAQIQEAIAKGERHDAEARAAREETARIERERFAGCLSVTDCARELGMSRTALFERLSRDGWLVRGGSGNWTPTRWAVSQGFMMSRGPVSSEHGRLTPMGRQELVRQLNVMPKDDNK
ncbi:phage antirepressor KilAC domain-containing protein [Caballeronia sp. BR00000012568055]|uniref:phage antirepressor KilAC domain-containing protein n=1 Tax=Caballeronia sp. BR00000012568055 TaxID=2918761 RepID=UPI0023F86FF6|nr:phage antirepressor KilAC domain-containing protein [Caballeronia sp. BR00000012568055]